MATFTPPTGDFVPSVLPETKGVQRRLFRYYGPWPQGRSVVMVSGHYTIVDNPYADLLTPGGEGITWFLGGHVYTVADDIANLLALDGFVVGGYTPPPGSNPGFGDGGFGEGQFGA